MPAGRALSALLLVLLLLLVATTVAACGSRTAQPHYQWTAGFWFWGGSSEAVRTTERGAPLDSLYVMVADVRETFDWPLRLNIGEAELPAAREYWAVLRLETRGAPSVDVAERMARRIADLAESEPRLKGVQLDVDCPAGSLHNYAVFLQALRKDLAPGIGLSITALLDWFRDGTAIAEVIAAVDEFVPQFYDVGDGFGSRSAAIAAPVSSTTWARAFNRFGKRYRIGVSTFGRARQVRRPGSDVGYPGVHVLVDRVRPLTFAMSPDFRSRATTTKAGELVLRYEAAHRANIHYYEFEQGDAVEFTLPTPESVERAVAEAKKFGGSCAGVLFFRWPGRFEETAMHPDDVLEAAGARTGRVAATAGVKAVDASCAAVSCVDLFLATGRPLSPKLLRYRIQSSVELEYFVPREDTPARMSGPNEIEVRMPPYCSADRLYVGRAVTARAAVFTVKEEEVLEESGR